MINISFASHENGHGIAAYVVPDGIGHVIIHLLNSYNGDYVVQSPSGIEAEVVVQAEESEAESDSEPKKRKK
jgi:hypothetical protein